jgi:DNA-binding response OmpR family regulator
MKLSEIDILIVDDNAPMRALLKSYFTAHGAMKLREAANGQSALTLLDRKPADVVLLDHSMPGMTGLDLARAIRGSHDPRMSRTRIIMITGHGDVRLVAGARDAGVDEFLIKPVTMNDLLGRVQKVMTQGRAFVSAGDFTGPDRRRRDKPPPQGQNRRSAAFDLD